MVNDAIATTAISVRYAETDQMGIAYYGVYPVWFEVGRTALMARRGYPYHELEAQGILLPVSETYYRLIAPARYGEEILVDTSVARLESRRVTFDYRVRRGEKTLAEGWTRLVCVGRDFRPRRFPEWLLAAMGPASADDPSRGKP
jgi:acyl-CoA thioester hydrolase